MDDITAPEHTPTCIEQDPQDVAEATETSSETITPTSAEVSPAIFDPYVQTPEQIVQSARQQSIYNAMQAFPGYPIDEFIANAKRLLQYVTTGE